MSKPRILMLDEPSLGLAPLIVAEIFKIIKSLKERGMTILLVEQMANQALAISDRAYVLEVGSIVMEAPARNCWPASACARPISENTRADDEAIMSSKPLNGIRVLELGQLIAGPFAAKMLGEFGAEVIKIEPPGKGDPLRNWRLLHDGTSVWWQVQSRNKKSVSLDLRKPEAQDLIRALVKDIDVVVENFKPGTMEGWGLAGRSCARSTRGW